MLKFRAPFPIRDLSRHAATFVQKYRSSVRESSDQAAIIAALNRQPFMIDNDQLEGVVGSEAFRG